MIVVSCLQARLLLISARPCDSVIGNPARFGFVWSVSHWSMGSVVQQISGAPRWQRWVCLLRSNEVGEVPLPPGHGAKVGQGVLFAVVCNCTRLSSHSAPPPLLSPPPRLFMPTMQTTLLLQGLSQPSRGSKTDQLLWKRSTGGQTRSNGDRLLPSLPVINYPSFPGAPLHAHPNNSAIWIKIVWV